MTANAITLITALVTAVVTWAISDSALATTIATAILGLITGAIGTTAARASVYTKPSAEKLERQAWTDGAVQALYVRPPTRDETPVINPDTRTVMVTPAAP